MFTHQLERRRELAQAAAGRRRGLRRGGRQRARARGALSAGHAEERRHDARRSLASLILPVRPQGEELLGCSLLARNAKVTSKLLCPRYGGLIWPRTFTLGAWTATASADASASPTKTGENGTLCRSDRFVKRAKMSWRCDRTFLYGDARSSSIKYEESVPEWRVGLEVERSTCSRSGGQFNLCLRQRAGLCRSSSANTAMGSSLSATSPRYSCVELCEAMASCLTTSNDSEAKRPELHPPYGDDIQPSK